MVSQQEILGAALTNFISAAQEAGDDIPSPPLSAIKSLTIKLDWSHYNIRMGMANPVFSFFFLPRLEDIDLYLPHGTPLEWPDSDLLPAQHPRTAKRLKSLAITANHDDGAPLVEMVLKACPVLETFCWTIHRSFDDPAGFSLTEMSSALRAAVGPVAHLTLLAIRTSGIKGMLFAPRINVLPFAHRIRRDLEYAGETQGVRTVFDTYCFSMPLYKPTQFGPARGDENVPEEDWDWLVRDETEEEDEAEKPGISLD